MARMLITGGAGFIGSHVAELALKEGFEVAVLDNLSSGRAENVPAGATLHRLDVRDAAGVDALFAEFRPDVVSHQAAQASVAVSVREPRLDADVNVMGTLSVLDAARAHGSSRVIFASTGGAIYGEVPEGRRAAVDWAPDPQSPYATSKLAAERYLETYRVQYGLTYTVLRYANVYGPRQDPHGEAGVIAIFANRLREGQSVRVNARAVEGDRGCVRDYVYVEDVARMNLLAAQGKLSAPVLNVGSGVPTDTQTLAERMAAALGRTPELRFAPPRAGDVQFSLLDPADVEGALGRAIPLDQGLGRTLDAFAVG